MANIVNTSLLGWVDLDHVLRITEIKRDEARHNQFFFCAVYVMMQNEPFTAFSDTFYVDDEEEYIEAIRKKFEESYKAFILAWHKGKK